MHVPPHYTLHVYVHRCWWLIRHFHPSVLPAINWRRYVWCAELYIYHIRQNFHWLKFSPKAHTLYWDKNFAKFNFANCASYIIDHIDYVNVKRSCGWSSRVAMCICVCTRDRTNVSKVSLCKKIFTNGMHWRNWRKIFPGKNWNISDNVAFNWLAVFSLSLSLSLSLSFSLSLPLSPPS